MGYGTDEGRGKGSTTYQTRLYCFPGYIYCPRCPAVTVKGSTATFRGFLVIAHVPGVDHMLLGSFTPQNGSQQTLNCSFTGASNEMESTIAHNNSAKIDFQSITTEWMAPSDHNGMVDFRCVLISFQTSLPLEAIRRTTNII